MILFLFGILLSLLIAYINNEERLRDIAHGITTQVDHALWFAVWTIPCIFMAIFNLKLAVSIWLLHGSVFPVFFNLMAGVKPFNLSVTTTAKYDKAIKVVVDWLNRKYNAGIPYTEAMFLPDLIILTVSIILLWLSL